MQGMVMPNLAASAPGVPGKAALPPSLAASIAGAPSLDPENSNVAQTLPFPELMKQAIAREAGAAVTPGSVPAKADCVCPASGRDKSASNKSGQPGAAKRNATLASLSSTTLLPIVAPILVSVPVPPPVCSNAAVDSATAATPPSATQSAASGNASQGQILPIRNVQLTDDSRSPTSDVIELPPESVGSLEQGPSQPPQSNETPAKPNAAETPSAAVLANSAMPANQPQAPQAALAAVQIVQQPYTEATPLKVAAPLHPALASVVKQVQQLQAQPSAAHPPAPPPATVSLSATQRERAQRLQINERQIVEERSALSETSQDVPPGPAVHPKAPTVSLQSAPAAAATSNSASDNSSKMSSGESSSGQSENQAASKSEYDGRTDLLKPAQDPPSFAQTMHSSAPDTANTAATSSAISNLSLPQNHAFTNGANLSSSPPATPPSGQTPLAHLPDATPNRFVNSAQLLQSSGHSEMRIELQTDKLGNVELRARVVGDELGAAITVEKRDAHAALAVELPALQQALSAKQLRVDQVTLLQGSLSSAAGNAERDARQQQAPTPNRFPAGSSWSPAGTPALLACAEHAPTGIFDIQGRLNVHA